MAITETLPADLDLFGIEENVVVEAGELDQQQIDDLEMLDAVTADVIATAAESVASSPIITASAKVLANGMHAINGTQPQLAETTLPTTPRDPFAPLTNAERAAWFDRRDYFTELESNAEKSLCNRMLAVERLRGQVKMMREMIKEESAELEGIRGDGAEWLQNESPEEAAIWKKSNSRGDSDNQAVVEPENSNFATTALPPSPPAKFSGDWRTAGIELLALTDGIQSKLIECGISSIGKLEELRAAVATEFKRWPKGIGKGKVEEIHAKLLPWLEVNRDGDPMGEIKKMKVEKVETAEVMTGEQFSEAVNSVIATHAKDKAIANAKKRGRPPKQKQLVEKIETTVPATAVQAVVASEKSETVDCSHIPPIASPELPYSNPVHNDPPNRDELLAQRASELDDGKPDSLQPKMKNPRSWQEGVEAYEKDWELKDCGWTPGEKQDDWIRGFCSAAAEDDGEDDEGEDSESEDEGESDDDAGE